MRDLRTLNGWTCAAGSARIHVGVQVVVVGPEHLHETPAGEQIEFLHDDLALGIPAGDLAQVTLPVLSGVAALQGVVWCRGHAGVARPGRCGRTELEAPAVTGAGGRLVATDDLHGLGVGEGDADGILVNFLVTAVSEQHDLAPAVPERSP
jgi:hypothetical protein